VRKQKLIIFSDAAENARRLLLLSQFVYITHKARLEVGSLIAMNNPALGKLVNQRNHLGKLLNGFLLIGGVAQPFYGITGGFCIISVPEPFGIVGTDSFLC
jgi:hypothetical protein